MNVIFDTQRLGKDALFEAAQYVPSAAASGVITSQPAPDGQNQRFVGTTSNASSGSYTLTGSAGGVTVGPSVFAIVNGAFDFTVTGLAAGSYTPQLLVTGEGGTSVVTGTSAFSIIGITGGGAVGNPPTVSSVTVSPSTATISNGEPLDFNAVVAGSGNPSQAVTWATTIGTIDAAGMLTPPAANGTVQTGTVTATSSADDTKSGTASISIAAAGTAPVSTVTAVTVSPSAPVVTGGTTQQFSASVIGTDSPSQGVTWTATLGSINSSGLLTVPAATSVLQSGTVTATSTFDPRKSGSASFTVAALVPPVDVTPPDVLTVSLVLGEAHGPGANLSGLMVSFHAAAGPHATGAALYQSSTETTDSSGRLSFTLPSESIAPGVSGLLAVLMPDGRHYLGIVPVV